MNQRAEATRRSEVKRVGGWEVTKIRRWEDGKVGDRIKGVRDLEVYKLAFDCAMKIFEITKNFPSEERYSLTDQIRRSSRSVCSNLAEENLGSDLDYRIYMKSYVIRDKSVSRMS